MIFEDLDKLVDTDPIRLRDEAWKAIEELDSARAALEACERYIVTLSDENAKLRRGR